MKRKLLFISITFFALTLLSIIVQSCEDFLSYDGTICTVEFTGLNPRNDNSPDTFAGEIGFLVIGDFNSKVCYVPLDFGLISTCNATTKCARWQNDFQTSSFQILLDKPIIIAGDTVKQNTDLFLNSPFKTMTTIKREQEDCKFVECTIKLSQDLVSKIVFEKGVYNVTFNCNTTDNRTFTKQRQVIFKE